MVASRNHDTASRAKIRQQTLPHQRHEVRPEDIRAGDFLQSPSHLPLPRRVSVNE